MRWLNPNEAQSVAFSAPDSQELAFRLPGHLHRDRVHSIAHITFGHRAVVECAAGSWVVKRRPFRCTQIRARRAQRRQRELLRRPIETIAMRLRRGL